MNIQKTTLGIAGVIIAGVSFFGGVKYDQSKSVALTTGNQNFSAQGGQMRALGTGANGAPRGVRVMNGGATGSIVAKDATSITVALRDGGSKIIFLSANTIVSKTDAGTTSDLMVGKEVSVNGTPNADGSITAQSIQLRPNVVAGTS